MQKLKQFFSPPALKSGGLIALSFSAFVYLFHFGFTPYLLNTLIGLYAFYLLLKEEPKSLFFGGFFIGLLWFYWIGFSFIYYDMAWAVPLNALGFGLIYGAIFYLVGYVRHPLGRAAMLFLLSFFEPFDFNWLQPELLFVYSYLGVEKWQYLLILLSLGLFVYFRRNALALLLLLPALHIPHTATPALPFEISLYQTTLPQESKWEPSTIPVTINNNFKAIQAAIQAKKSLIVLPESAFPLFLNRDPYLQTVLKEFSQKIDIVTGALLAENGHNYNAAYYFHQGELQIAKKMILVPFGEYIPLPSFLARPINEAVFGGAVDYLSADTPTDFTIHGVKFRNAICYEATCHEMYEDAPKYIIAISNNGWFMPSIEPSLQRLLMQFYANKHHTIILHAANAAGGGIIYPQ